MLQVSCLFGIIPITYLWYISGIIEGAAQGKGRGRQVIAVARTSDLVLMMLDATKGIFRCHVLYFVTIVSSSEDIILSVVCDSI